VGLKLEGRLAPQLAVSFDEMFARADFRHKHFVRLRKLGAKKIVALPTEQILFSGRVGDEAPSNAHCEKIWRTQNRFKSSSPIFCRRGGFVAI